MTSLNVMLEVRGPPLHDGATELWLSLDKKISSSPFFLFIQFVKV
jgi:hypothetical protein